MSRLQKKCLIASSALHALLVVIVLAGSAFLLKREEAFDKTVLTFVPDRVVDDAMKRATGAPAPMAAQPPAATPPQQPVTPPVQPPATKVEPTPETKPKPEKEPAKKPEPVQKPVTREPDPEPEPIKKDARIPADPKRKPKQDPKTTEAVTKPTQKPVVNLRPIVRNSAEIERLRKEAVAAQAAQAAKAEADRRLRVDSALSNFASKTATLTTENVGLSAIDTGTVGISYASYNDWVKKVYWDAWQVPNDLPPGDATVTVRVTLRKDGSVASASITGPSGISKLDDNIRKLLARVKDVGKKFPDGAKEETRTYDIDFNLKSKLEAG